MRESKDQEYRLVAESDGLLNEDGTAWNVQLTRLLRNTERHTWGNWTLDPTIKVGAVGWFGLTDSQFQSTGTSFDPPLQSQSTNTDWHIEKGDVRQSSAGVEFKVPYKDPTTGIEVSVGMQSKWEFGTKGSLISQGSTVRIDYADNPADYMLRNYDQFLELARKYNKADGDRIDQGFGMITRVWLTSGCVNVGSRQDNASFSITGSVDGIAAITGSDESASLKGSYKSTDTVDNIEKRTFPGKANVVEAQPVGYAYEFTSFAGRTIVPRWVSDIPYLNLWLDNGGSYIVDAKLSYLADGEKHTRTVRVSGGMDGQITGIPISATDLDIELHFVAGASQFLRVQNPLGAWHLGRGHLKLTGWWPGPTGATWID
ncbi:MULTISPECIES: hypothetical protein [unclassified Luteimonas]